MDTWELEDVPGRLEVLSWFAGLATASIEDDAWVAYAHLGAVAALGLESGEEE